MPELTLKLTEPIYDTLVALAGMSGDSCEAVAGAALGAALHPLGDLRVGDANALVVATDDEVRSLAEMTMAPALDARLGDLLAAQQAASLTSSQMDELEALMQIYQVGQIRKAFALREAARRGLSVPKELEH